MYNREENVFPQTGRREIKTYTLYRTYMINSNSSHENKFQTKASFT